MTAAVSHEARPVIRVEQHMNLPFSLSIRPAHGLAAAPEDWSLPHAEEIQAATDRAFDIIAAADRTFSLWKPESDVSRLARFEATLAELDPQVEEVWQLCETAEELTDGLFTAFSRNDSGSDPRKQEAIFDPTGLVKGWALEKAAAALSPLLDLGLAYCLNGGGDIIAAGASAKAPWRIGIEDCLNPTAIFSTVLVRDGAVATSGTYARGRHIYSPALGGQTTWTGALTVCGPSVMWADVLATALFANPGSHQQILSRFPGYEVAQDRRF